MNLQLSLLLIGLGLIALIFGISRYSNIVEKVLVKIKALNKRTLESNISIPKRTAKNAPILNVDENAADDVPSYEFSGMEAEDIEESNNISLTAFDKQSDLNHNTNAPQDTHVSEVAQSEQPEPQEQQEPQEPQEPQEDDKSGPFTSLKQIDFWIKLSPNKPSTKANVLANLQGWRSIKFPVQLHVLTEDEPQWLSLEEMSDETMVVDVVASYQLIDQGNATTLDDIDRFTSCVSNLGKGLEAKELLMATSEEALIQSQALAQFHDTYSSPISVSVCAPNEAPFMGKHVETSAKQQGLEFQDGDYVRLKRMGPNNIVLYRMILGSGSKFNSNMSSDSKINSVIFTTMPVLSLTPSRDTKEMLDAVKAFSSRVTGNIRMVGKNDFQADQLLELHSQVGVLEKNIRELGLEPGGPEVHRIFF